MAIAHEYSDISGISEPQYLHNYASMGFNATTTHAFAELRAEQRVLLEEAKSTVRRFRELKLQEDQKDSEDPCEQMEYSGKSSEYTEDREMLMKRFRKWMLESAYQIRANFVDPVYDQKRLRRVVDVINKVKVCLKATTPLGIETEDEEEDRHFL